MKHEDELIPVVVLITFLVGVLFIVLVSCGTFDKGLYIVVDDKYWVSTAYATETHTEWSYECDYDGDCSLESERVTETVCSEDMQGKELPVTYSKRCENEGEDHHTEVSYKILYHIEDSVETRTANTDLEKYRMLKMGNTYEIVLRFSNIIETK